MRLFSGLFTTLAGQALLAAVLPGALLIWNLDRGNETYLATQDRQALNAFAMLVAAEIRTGTPPAAALPAVQRRFAASARPGDPAAPLLGRVALYAPGGERLAGAQPDANGIRLERPVLIDDRAVAIARIVGPRTTTAASYRFVRDQVIGFGAAQSKDSHSLNFDCKESN